MRIVRCTWLRLGKIRGCNIREILISDIRWILSASKGTQPWCIIAPECRAPGTHCDCDEEDEEGACEDGWRDLVEMSSFAECCELRLEGWWERSVDVGEVALKRVRKLKALEQGGTLRCHCAGSHLV